MNNPREAASWLSSQCGVEIDADIIQAQAESEAKREQTRVLLKQIKQLKKDVKLAQFQQRRRQATRNYGKPGVGLVIGALLFMGAWAAIIGFVYVVAR